MTTLNPTPTTTYDPTTSDPRVPSPRAAGPAPRRPRSMVWPFAGLVAGLTGAAASFFLAETKEVYDAKGGNVSTAFLLEHLNSATAQKVGAGLAIVSTVAALVFLIGLARFAQAFAAHRESWLTALRWSSSALLGTATIGASMRYISSGGHPDGVDHKAYTDEAIGAVAVLADQLAFAVYLPGLVVMGVIALLAMRDRLFPRVVGAVAMVLAVGSTAATLAIGLPYSSGLVFPLFCLLIGVAGIASRKAH